jgi:hypothetical protein
MEHIPYIVANMSVIEPRALWIVGLLALLGHGHGQQRKPVTVGGATRCVNLPRFGESRKRVGTEKAGEFIAALVALIVGWMGDPPQVLGVLVAASIFLFALDYSTAHRAARLAGERITTNRIRTMTAAKLQSYWISASVVVCLGVMIRSWLPIVGIFGWLAYCEAISNLENVRKMALASGKAGERFYGGVTRLADKFLGEIPGADMATEEEQPEAKDQPKASDEPKATSKKKGTDA